LAPAVYQKLLDELIARGKKNGVEGLRVVHEKELRKMEPKIHPEAIGALFAPSAGTLTPYEFTIALCENAADNGVEFRLRREVVGILGGVEGGMPLPKGCHKDAKFCLEVRQHHPRRFHHHSFAEYTKFLPNLKHWQELRSPVPFPVGVAFLLAVMCAAAWLQIPEKFIACICVMLVSCLWLLDPNHSPLEKPFTEEKIQARYVVNCAGLGSDKVAQLVGDASFKIKPRIGEYILLNKNQGSVCNHILFPCPGKMGKGILVQRTLWGNLILGPTAADVHDPLTGGRDKETVLKTILQGCRNLIPEFDAGEVIHSFAGARAKSSRGDWIIEECSTAKGLVHAAGIDSPGLAGSPAIAKEVVRLLQVAGLECRPNPRFNPIRKPIIVPKFGWKIAKQGKLESIKVNAQNKPGMKPEHHVVCRCEKVTEAEIVDSIHRSLPVDSTQAVRKRTRAGMGHCQGEYCESRVKSILAREMATKETKVGTRPWPATSLIPQRWLTDGEKENIRGLA